MMSLKRGINVFSISLFFILLASYVSALDVTIKCPESVVFNEEFECSLRTNSINGNYDLKVDISVLGKTVTEIYNPFTSKWSSSYYYINSFITPEDENKEKAIKVRVKENANSSLNGTIKFRNSDDKNKKYSFGFLLGIVGNKTGEEEKDIEDARDKKEVEKEPIVEKDVNETFSDIEVNNNISETVINKTGENNEKDENESIINLNPHTKITGKTIYESKNEVIKNLSIYGFGLFLILLIVLLLLKWYKKSRR